MECVLLPVVVGLEIPSLFDEVMSHEKTCLKWNSTEKVCRRNKPDETPHELSKHGEVPTSAFPTFPSQFQISPLLFWDGVRVGRS